MPAPRIHPKALNTILLFLPSDRWITTAKVSKLSGLKRGSTLLGLWAAVGLHMARVSTVHSNHGSYRWRRTGDPWSS